MLRLKKLTKPMKNLMIKNVPINFGLLRIALVVSVGFPLIFASNALAQNPPPPPPPGAAPAPTQGAAEVERVIVTGSNIPTAEEVGANPVFSLNRDLINKSGQGNTVEDLLKTQSVIGANSIPASNNGVAQLGPSGTSSISLRGFDPSASLVLIDGRRVAPFVGGGGTFANSGGAFVDLVSLPVAAIQSIEILKDGASTTYGADAVAGVVNLKFYKDYRGVQATVQYGNTLDKDAAIYSGDLLFGIGDDKVQIAGDINFYHHNSLFNRDRGNSAKPPFLSTNSSPENLQLADAVVIAAGGTPASPGNPLTFS